MPRTKQIGDLTPLELEIMKVLWNGSGTVQSVQKGLGRELAYTTVQTMLNILHRKGKVDRVLADKAYLYRPTVTRKEIESQTIGDVVSRVFGGSAENLVMSMIRTDLISADKLRRLQQLIDEEVADDGR